MGSIRVAQKRHRESSCAWVELEHERCFRRCHLSKMEGQYMCTTVASGIVLYWAGGNGGSSLQIRCLVTSVLLIPWIHLQLTVLFVALTIRQCISSTHALHQLPVMSVNRQWDRPLQCLQAGGIKLMTTTGRCRFQHVMGTQRMATLHQRQKKPVSVSAKSP